MQRGKRVMPPEVADYFYDALYTYYTKGAESERKRSSGVIERTQKWEVRGLCVLSI